MLLSTYFLHFSSTISLIFFSNDPPRRFNIFIHFHDYLPIVLFNGTRWFFLEKKFNYSFILIAGFFSKEFCFYRNNSSSNSLDHSEQISQTCLAFFSSCLFYYGHVVFLFRFYFFKNQPSPICK